MDRCGMLFTVGAVLGGLWLGGVTGGEAWAATIQAQSEPAAGELRDYLSANGLLQRGLFEMAATDYRKFLAAYPKHDKAPTARYGLGVCLYRMEKPAEAAELLASVAGIDRFAFAAEAETILAQCQVAIGRIDDAQATLRRVLKRFPDHELADDASAALCEALQSAGKHDEVVRLAGEFAEKWAASPLRPRVEYGAALSEVASRQDEAAARRLSELLAGSPDDPVAEHGRILLAQCYHRLGKPEKALETYSAALKSPAARFAPEALVGAAGVMQDLKQFKESAALLDQMLKSHGEHPLARLARFLRARAWFETGQIERAAEMFAAVAPDDVTLADDAAYWCGKCELRRDNFALAVELLRAAIRKFPDSELQPEMQYDCAVALNRSGAAKEALQAVEAFLSRFGEHRLAADALQLAIVAAHEQKNVDAVQRYSSALLAKNPDGKQAAGVAFLAAESEFLAGRFQPAADAFRAFIERFSDDSRVPSARFRLAMSLYRLEKLDEARPLLEAVIESTKDTELSQAAQASLGDVLFRRGEWKAAEEVLARYVQAARSVPGVDDALLRLGLVRMRQGRFAEALRALDKLLADFADSPNRLAAQFERGQALLSLDKDAEAQGCFERVAAEAPDSEFARHAREHLATLAMRRKDYAAATKIYDSMLAADVGGEASADALLRRGQARLGQGLFAEAAGDLEQFLKQHPTHNDAPAAAVQLVSALARLDKPQDALNLIARAEREFAGRQSPASAARLCYEKAWCLRKLGKNGDARAEYRRLVEAGAGGESLPHALVELAELEAQAKDYDAARQLLRRVRELAAQAPDAVPASLRETAAYRLAVCEYDAGRAAEAARQFETFAKEFPKSALLGSALALAGECRCRLGQFDAAAKLLERVIAEFPSDPARAVCLLRLGESLAGGQKWARSEEAFRGYLDEFRDAEHWYQAQFGVGWALENQARHEDAIQAYRAVAERHKGPTAARAQFQIGECLFALKRHDEAARELLKVDILYAYPEWSAAALFEAGRCFEKLGKPVEARTQFKSVTEKYADTKWAAPARERISALSAAAPPGRAP
ncbi:MAG: Outer membrane protein assembly factor BamD [Phycisphaerae bacterium]|nr:Outer membrane protein assembly factor BamD [Phycisphaerae bacterium]